jgi:hypothetical protein
LCYLQITHPKFVRIPALFIFSFAPLFILDFQFIFEGLSNCFWDFIFVSSIDFILFQAQSFSLSLPRHLTFFCLSVLKLIMLIFSYDISFLFWLLSTLILTVIEYFWSLSIFMNSLQVCSKSHTYFFSNFLVCSRDFTCIIVFYASF